MPGLAQIQKFMCTIFNSEGMHTVEAYCLDNMLFYELSKFQVIKISIFLRNSPEPDFHNLWLRAPKSGAILFIDIFFDCTFTFNIIKSYKTVFEAFLMHFSLFPFSTHLPP